MYSAMYSTILDQPTWKKRILAIVYGIDTKDLSFGFWHSLDLHFLHLLDHAPLDGCVANLNNSDLKGDRFKISHLDTIFSLH